MLRRSRHGIGLIEFDFERTAPLNNQRYSIGTMLPLLSTRPFERVPYLHFHVGTLAELEHRLGQWAKRRAALPILVLAGHGRPGVVNVGCASGKRDHVQLERVVNLIANFSYGCWLHVGSCAALGLHGSHLRALLGRTNLVAISGYRVEVDFTLAIAFELLLLEALVNRAIDGRGVAAMRRWATFYSRGPFAPLGFRIISR